jgi:CcmD family protein
MGVKGLVATVLVLSWTTVLAQRPADPDFLRSTGQIYVVAAVCLVILATLLFYLIRLDRRLSKLEKRLPHE